MLKSNIKLYDHQIGALEFLFKNKKCLLAYPTGSGKTLIGLTAFLKYKQSNKVNKCIWVTLPSISSQVEETQKEYINKYSAIDIADVSHLTKGKREKVYKEDNFDLLVINYHKLKLDYNYLKSILSSNDTMIIFDEVHKIKNPKASMTKYAKQLASITDKLLAMTATPVMKDLQDIYNILSVTKIISLDYNYFSNTFCKFDWVRIKPIVKNGRRITKVRQLVGFKNIDNFYKTMSNKILVKKKSDLMNLPKFNIIELYLDKDTYINKAIKHLKQENDTIPQSYLEFATTSPSIILENKLPSSKLNEVYDFCKDNIEEKIILFSKYKTVVKYTAAYINKNFKEKIIQVHGDNSNQMQELKNDFINKDINYLVGNDVITTGLDGLHKVSNTVVLLDIPDTIGQYIQLIGRINRLGNNYSTVNIIVSIIKNSIDELKWLSLHSSASLLYKTDKNQLEHYLFNKNLLNSINERYDGEWVKKQINKNFNIKVN